MTHLIKVSMISPSRFPSDEKFLLSSHPANSTTNLTIPNECNHDCSLALPDTLFFFFSDWIPRESLGAREGKPERRSEIPDLFQKAELIGMVRAFWRAFFG